MQLLLAQLLQVHLASAAGCDLKALLAVQHVQSRSGRSGLSQHCSPATGTDGPSPGSAGFAAMRLTATNLTEFDALQRQISRKDRPRSGLHGEPACLSRSSCWDERALTRKDEVQVDRPGSVSRLSLTQDSMRAHLSVAILGNIHCKRSGAR